MFATIYALLYGGNYHLHERLLKSMGKYVPREHATIVLWCNTVCEKTETLIRNLTATGMPIQYFFSTMNVPKYKVMANLFHGERAPTTPWVVWFDDDSYITKPDWWQQTVEKIESTPNCCYMGQRWYVHHLRGQWDFITKAPWFKGREPEMCPTKKQGVLKPGVSFAQGAYWWLRTDIMRELHWPDERLVHNGGDTLLGEAIRQQGLPFTVYHYGVAVNKARRRGRSDPPAGSTESVRR